MLKLYLDNCCFNRPFDDQNQLKVFLETQAKLDIQEKILSGQYDLIWSYILNYENEQNPNRMIKHEISQWEKKAKFVIEASELILKQAHFLMQSTIHLKDALHVACAIVAHADYFITTDRKLLNKLSKLNLIRAVNPIDFIEETE